MKWIFYCLVLINVVYMGWENKSLFVEREAAGQSVMEGGYAEEGLPLVLLTERLPQLGSSEPPPTIGDSLASEEVTEVKAFTERSVSESLELKVELAEPEALVVDEIMSRRPEVKPSSATVSPKKMLCPHVGPFAEQGAGERFTVLLRDANIGSRLVPVDVVKGAENWVMIPSQGSRKASLALLKELQAKKIDSYLITEGEHRNAISLGLFMKQSSAEGVLEQMKLEGYEAQVEVRERTSKEFWVHVQASKDGYIDRESLEKLVNDQKDIKISESLCETFAQGS